MRIRSLLLLLFLAAAALRAQTQSSSLSGTIKDPSGAVVAGVQVRIVNTATGEAWAATSNVSGYYTIPLVKPGAYTLTAEAPGFKQHRQSGIVLETASPRAWTSSWKSAS